MGDNVETNNNKTKICLSTYFQKFGTEKKKGKRKKERKKERKKKERSYRFADKRPN